MAAGMGWGELASAIGGGFNTVVGAYQFIKSDQDRKKYEGMEIPTYKETPAMRSARIRAENMSKRGFTQAETNVFFQNLAKLSNQNYNRAIESGGGGLAGAVSAGIGYNKLGALNQYAGQDAALMRQNIKYADDFARVLQSLSNMNTQNEYARYVDMGKAITAERNAAISNIASGVSGGQVTSMGNNTGNNTPDVDTSVDSYGQQKQPQEAPVDYDPSQSGYNQGLNKNEWLYDYQNRNQNQNTESDPYSISVNKTSENYTW